MAEKIIAGADDIHPAIHRLEAGFQTKTPRRSSSFRSSPPPRVILHTLRPALCEAPEIPSPEASKSDSGSYGPVCPSDS